MKQWHKVLLGLSGFLVIAALGMFGWVYRGTQTSTMPRQQTSLALKWVHQAQFAGVYVAQEQGYYMDDGVELTILEGGVGQPSIERLVESEVDFAIVGADDLLVAVDKREPLVAVATIYQRSPVAFFSLAESGITTPYDFVDRTVGVKLNTGTYYTYIALLKSLGIDRSRINEVPVGVDMSSLYEGEVDVWMGFRMNEPKEAERAGYDVNLILPENYQLQMYADVLATRKEVVEQRPELVAAMVHATLRGWETAVRNPDAAVTATLAYSENDEVFERAFLAETVPLVKLNEGMNVGEMSFAQWNKTYLILKQVEIITQPLDVTQAYALEFIKANR